MDNEAVRKRLASMVREIEADVAALAMNDDLMAAVREVNTEEDRLKQRYANREITFDEYFALWSALMDRTPHEVVLASIKFSQAMNAALSKPTGTTEA